VNFKPLLTRVWTLVGNLDARVKNSAILSAILGVVVGLILGIPNCFADDPGPSQPGATSLRQYQAFVPRFACLEDKQNSLEYQTLNQLPKPGPRVSDADKVRVFRIIADYGRGARQNAYDMTKLLEGIHPPSQFVKEHQELVDYATLLQQLVDELERGLPGNLNLTDQQILSDPTLNDRMQKLSQMGNAINAALNRREFSPDFGSLYICPSAGPRPTATKVPITIVFPTISIPPVFITPFLTLPTPTPSSRATATPAIFNIRSPSPTPFFSQFVTPVNPFGNLLTPVR
jgi:hypothetical protein